MQHVFSGIKCVSTQFRELQPYALKSFEFCGMEHAKQDMRISNYHCIDDFATLVSNPCDKITTVHFGMILLWDCRKEHPSPLF